MSLCEICACAELLQVVSYEWHTPTQHGTRMNRRIEQVQYRLEWLLIMFVAIGSTQYVPEKYATPGLYATRPSSNALPTPTPGRISATAPRNNVQHELSTIASIYSHP